MKAYGVVRVGSACGWGCCFLIKEEQNRKRKIEGDYRTKRMQRKRARRFGKNTCYESE